MQAKEGSKRRLELLKEQEAIVRAVTSEAGAMLEKQFGSGGNSPNYAVLMEALILQVSGSSAPLRVYHS